MSRVFTGTISETGVVQLPNPQQDRVCSYLIQFEDDSFDGSVTIEGAALDSAFTGLALAYKNMVTGTNATAAITGNAMVLIDSSGIGVALDATVTSGELHYTAIPLIG